MRLDSFVFDSQFMYLADPDFESAYANQVLKNVLLTNTNNIRFYLKREPWDSERFKSNIGRLFWLENNINSSVEIENVLSHLRNYNCSYVRLNSSHSFCKQASIKGIFPLSTKVSQHLCLDQKKIQFDESLKYKKYAGLGSEEEILAQILELADRSFVYNRFREDKRFTSEMVDSIYSSWIRNEIKNQESELYYISEDQKLISFFLYRKNISPLNKYKIGFVSLIASSPDFKAKRYATHLLNYVLNEARKNQTNFIIANTESKNTSALNFFKANQFMPTAVLNEYHIWN